MSFQSVVRGNNTKALIESVGQYRRAMRKACQGIQDTETLEHHHRTSLNAAINHFRSVTKVGSKQSRQEFLIQLKRECKNAFDSFERRNNLLKSEKKQEVRRQISTWASAYASKLKQIGADEDDRSFERKSSQYEMEALAKLESVRTSLTHVMTELENELRSAIKPYYLDVKLAWKEKKMRKKEEHRRKCSDAKEKGSRQFERRLAELETKYYSNIQHLLNIRKNITMFEFDAETSHIPEKDAVRAYKSELERNLNMHCEKAKKYNEAMKSRKLLEYQKAVSTCLSTYENELEKIMDADDSVFEDKHPEFSDKALAKFDSEESEHRGILSEIADIRNQLQQKISSRLSKAKVVRGERRRKQMEKSTKECSEARYEIAREFQKAIYQVGQEYQPNISSILDKEKKNALSRYDHMTSRHKEVARIYKILLKQELRALVDNAKENNQRLCVGKISQFNSYMEKCLSDYKTELDSGSLNRHGRYKRRALTKFDPETRNFQNFPEVIELRKALSRKIDAYFVVVVNRHEEENNRVMRKKADDCMERMVNDLERKLSSYHGRYRENLPAEIDELKIKFVVIYRNEMSENTHSNPRSLEMKLNKVAKRAIDLNTRNESIEREKCVNAAGRYAAAFERSLEEAAAEAYLDESIIDKCQQAYKDHVRNDRAFESLPYWGQSIVMEEIENSAQRIKKQNEENKKHRGVKREGWKKFKRILATAVSFLTGVTTVASLTFLFL